MRKTKRSSKSKESKGKLRIDEIDYSIYVNMIIGTALMAVLAACLERA
jgi:hypothetical protein